MDDQINETLARVLERSGGYRVLRRVPAPDLPRSADAGAAAAGHATGIVLDTETTGLADDDEVVELAMARFAYDPGTARVTRVVDTFQALRQPGKPIPPEVTRLTGITAAAVAGRTIDADAVARFAGGAGVVVAHNAAFDRPVVERAWPAFAALPWACSLTQVDWRAQGLEGRSLGQLLAGRRLFHDGHRALDDCLALLHLLRLPTDVDASDAGQGPWPAERDRVASGGATAFEQLMRAAAATTVRVWAAHAPFGTKDGLKARGYRWASGCGGGPRAWWRDVFEGDAGAEVEWLRVRVYDDPAARPPTRRLTALDRFSARADAPDL